MDKQIELYTYNSNKKEQSINILKTWTDLNMTMLSKRSQTKKYILFDSIYIKS